MRPCAAQGCRAIVQKGRCAQHTQAKDRERGTAQARGYDYQWSLYSQRYLSEHPLCGERADFSMDITHSRCIQQGRSTAAQCVDHTVPMSQGGSKWDERNHMAACFACNTWKAKTIER